MIDYFSWKDFDEAVEQLVSKISREKYRALYGVPRGGLVIAIALSHRLELPLSLTLKSGMLVVDDISDTGNTLTRFRDHDIATIHYAAGTKVQPTYWVAERKGDWIVYPWEYTIWRRKIDG